MLREYDPEHEGRIYISTQAAGEMAELLDYASPETVAQMSTDLTDALDQLEAQAARIEELEEFETAANYTLAHFDKNVRRKPGRKPRPDPEPIAA